MQVVLGVAENREARQNQFHPVAAPWIQVARTAGNVLQLHTGRPRPKCQREERNDTTILMGGARAEL